MGCHSPEKRLHYFCAIMLALCIAVALLRLKTGGVKREDLLAKREAIAVRAITMTEAEDAEITQAQ